MIKNQDRSKWIGASDTSFVVGNWKTDSFREWWLLKLGINAGTYKSKKMEYGNAIEIPIIRAIEKLEGEKIKIGRRPYYKISLRLRCNYDGLRKDEVIEIKSTGSGFKNVPKNYWRQCQVLMYVKKKKSTALYQYKMTEYDYVNPYFPEIDEKRIIRHVVEYDEQFIKNEYLPRLRYLASCLRAKKFPKEEDYVQFNDKKRKGPFNCFNARC